MGELLIAAANRRSNRIFIVVAVGLLGLTLIASFTCTEAANSATLARAADNVHASTCRRELENANKTMAKWAETMEQMVNESKLPASIRESIHNEANKVLDMIEDFGQQVYTKKPVDLAKDLVQIRRHSNRMALDIYLNTFDMRWPQNSLGLGITVERVQQACLDRQTIQALESAPNPLELLLSSLPAKMRGH